MYAYPLADSAPAMMCRIIPLRKSWTTLTGLHSSRQTETAPLMVRNIPLLWDPDGARSISFVASTPTVTIPTSSRSAVITWYCFEVPGCLRISQVSHFKDVKTVESKFKRSLEHDSFLRFLTSINPCFFPSDIQDKRVGPEAEKLFAEAKEMLVQNWDLSDLWVQRGDKAAVKLRSGLSRRVTWSAQAHKVATLVGKGCYLCW